MHKFAGMLLPAFCVLAVAGNAEAQEAVIKIGHVAPMSGGQAHLGKDNEAGAKLAIEDLNKAGITIGGKKAKFVLVSEDDGADPRQGTAVAQKLVDAKVVGVVGHLNSGTSIPASKIYYDAGIPQISPSSTAPKYTQQGFNTTFRVVANDSQLGARLGQYAVSQLKAKKVAVIDDRTAYGQGVAEEFSKAAKAAGAAIVATQFTTDKATEFSAILTAVKSAAPDVVFYGGMDAQAGPLLRQMKQLGINAKLMGGDGICTEGLVNLAGDGMTDGQVICAEAGGVTGEEEKGMEAFRADFKKRTGGDVQLYAPYVYDAVMVLADSIKKAGSAEPDRYLPYLAKADYKGVTGHISFDNKGDIKNGSLTLYSYKAGKRERIAVVK